MSEVKRYTIVECHNDEEFWAKMKEVKHGDYVLYSDYTELEQQKAELINLLCERCDYIGACEVEEILCAVKKYK